MNALVGLANESEGNAERMNAFTYSVERYDSIKAFRRQRTCSVSSTLETGYYALRSVGTLRILQWSNVYLLYFRPLEAWGTR